MTTEINIEDIQKKLDDAVLNYNKISQAHQKLKDDFRELKTKSSDMETLQQQIEDHIKEKTKIQSDFDAFKTNTQKKEIKAALSTALTEVVKPDALSVALKLVSLDGIELDDKGEVKTESIQAAVNALKESESFLFKDASGKPDNSLTTPPIKHAVDRMTQSAYFTEIQDAVKKGDAKLLEDVVAKYRK